MKQNNTITEKINLYIENSPDFSKPILNQLRSIILKTDPSITEDWKWNAPCFASNGLICWIAAFKKHVGINFFKGSLINDTYKLFENSNSEKGNRIIKYADLNEIDEKKLSHYIKEAVKINQKGIKIPTIKKELIIPDYFIKALKSHPRAYENFMNFSYSHQKEYVEWITEAKKEETRQKRIKKSIEMLSLGKGKNDKYKKR